MFFKKEKIKFFILTGIIVTVFFVDFLNMAVDASERVVDVDELVVKYAGGHYESFAVAGNIDDQINYLSGLPEVEFVEPNYKYFTSLRPNDKYYDEQWYLEKIRADRAWNSVRKSPNVVIAVIDSGIQISHPELHSSLWENQGEIRGNNIDDDKNGFVDDMNGWDFVDNTNDPNPKFQEGYTEGGVLHGTIVSGIAMAGGNNKIGVAGVTWEAKLMSLKALDDKGEGRVVNIVRALDYAVDNGADIVNLSFTGLGDSSLLYNSIKRAYDRGVIVVAAAGNEKDQGSGYDLDETPMYPACYSGPNGENMVIAVAATDGLDQKSEFSSHGNCVDVSAPGEKIYNLTVYNPAKEVNGKILDKYYDGFWSGTSVSTPMVSGALALIIEANPTYSRKQVVDALLGTTNNITRLNPDYFNELGAGRLDVEAAVLRAVSDLKSESYLLLTAPMTNDQSIVKKFSISGSKQDSFLAYGENFYGGATVAAGDVNRDGYDEIITGAGYGGGPHVRIFDKDNSLIAQFFAYDKNFRGGVNVVVGDLDGDGIYEIITGAGYGGGPHVRIFDLNGKLKNHFFAYDKNFRGGVNVAVGDMDGDGVDEIITGAGNGGGPHVRMFDMNGNLKGQFFAYDKNFRGGVRIAAGSLETSAKNTPDTIITAPGPGGGPHIRFFDPNGVVLREFFAFNADYRGGVQIAAEDIDQDGVAEIAVATGSDGPPYVRIFEINGRFNYSFYAYDEQSSVGVNIGFIKIKTSYR